MSPDLVIKYMYLRTKYTMWIQGVVTFKVVEFVCMLSKSDLMRVEVFGSANVIAEAVVVQNDRSPTVLTH